MAKVTNYTPEQIVVLTETYVGLDNKAELAEIALAVGKSVPSVRAKLSNLGVYKSAEKAATASGKSGDNKTAIAEAIAKQAGLTEVEIEGLAKATKGPLEKILAALTNREPEADAEATAES